MLNAWFDPIGGTWGRAAGAALLVAGVWLAAAGGLRAAEAGPFFRIGTGSEAGSEFAVGQVLAEILQAAITGEACGLPDCSDAPVLVAAQLSDGSLANIEDLRAGRVEAALVDAPAAAWAQRGEGPFAAGGPVAGLRAVGALYPALLQVATLERSGIRRIADLRGRRVSLDGQGSGTRPIARRVLAAHGLDEADVDARYLEPGIALERLAAGKIDAFFALGSVPLEAVVRVGEIAEVRLLPVEAEGLAADEALAAALRPATLPAGAYAGMPALETVATSELLLVGEHLDDDLVYAVTARLWAAASVRRLRAAHPAAAGSGIAGFALEAALDGLAVPLHPGAERFYRERGLLP